MSWNWRGDFREFGKMINSSREARKKYPRKDRQRLLRHDILLLAAKAEEDGMRGLWGYYVMQCTRLSSGAVYLALTVLVRDDYLRRIETDKHPHIRYILTQRGREYVAKWL